MYITLCVKQLNGGKLFYHFLDITCVNAFILFEDFRRKHADIPELQRPDRYGQLNLTTELIRQLADLDVHADVPLVKKTKTKKTCVHNAFYYHCYDQGKKQL